MTDPASVLIVGAGPTGLWLALWLTHLGVRVRIVDRAAEPGTTSRALAVHARTMEFGEQIGITAALVDAGVEVEALNLWVGGKRAARVPIRSIGDGLSPFPFPLVLPQDTHERVLIDELSKLGIQVERPVTLGRIDQDEHRVRAVLTRNGVDETVECSYLAGCDGASSTVREQLGIDFQGGTYSGMFYVADVDATGPAVDGSMHVDIEDEDFAIVFPLRVGERVRLVGLLRDHTETRPEMTFDDVKGRAIAHLQLQVTSVHWFSTYRVHHRVAERFRLGRAFLLGDAAHIHSPVGGQGMNTGIGDAVNLSWKLAAVLQRRAAGSLLDTYEPERIAFARLLVGTTDRAFTVVTATGGIARLLRTKVAPALAPWATQFASLRRLIFRVVSQTRVRYRHSALSSGRAGRVHGGDRLPWVEMAPGHDNFAALKSLEWQVHVYGEAAADLSSTCATLRLKLHCFDWVPAMERAGLKRSALYLIRPDGYVGFADEQADSKRLLQYFRDQESLIPDP